MPWLVRLNSIQAYSDSVSDSDAMMNFRAYYAQTVVVRVAAKDSGARDTTTYPGTTDGSTDKS